MQTVYKGIIDVSPKKEVLFLEQRLPYAHLTEKQLEKIKETEAMVNQQPDRNEENEIILLAFKQEGR